MSRDNAVHRNISFISVIGTVIALAGVSSAMGVECPPSVSGIVNQVEIVNGNNCSIEGATVLGGIVTDGAGLNKIEISESTVLNSGIELTDTPARIQVYKTRVINGNIQVKATSGPVRINQNIITNGHVQVTDGVDVRVNGNGLSNGNIGVEKNRGTGQQSTRVIGNFVANGNIDVNGNDAARVRNNTATTWGDMPYGDITCEENISLVSSGNVAFGEDECL